MSFNVLRWTVLSGGIFYGFIHNNSLKKEADKEAWQHKVDNRRKLISEARAEYARLHPKPVIEGAPTTDVDSPDFDPVKVIDWAVKHIEA
ncbi:F1F0 ATP synthase subunit E [Starmerella bacillaris]|uniref:ATP synthase F(0) complex subunit e, mitochondrial n=1 Tax=Starmerella bacillaris TaxID=1247836 RepID=A0AAV5RP52_STABA|nr:F1F0 ATP synthase subunit E [Starmerella bacillaris]